MTFDFLFAHLRHQKHLHEEYTHVPVGNMIACMTQFKDASFSTFTGLVHHATWQKRNIKKHQVLLEVSQGLTIDTPLFYGGDFRGKKQLEGLIHQWVGYFWTAPENGEDDEEFSARVKMAKHTWWFCNLEFKVYCSDWVQVGGSWYITPRIMRSQNLLFRKQLKRWIEYTYSNAI